MRKLSRGGVRVVCEVSRKDAKSQRGRIEKRKDVQSVVFIQKVWSKHCCDQQLGKKMAPRSKVAKRRKNRGLSQIP